MPTSVSTKFNCIGSFRIVFMSQMHSASCDSMFNRVHPKSYYSCLLQSGITKIGRSAYWMYSNDMLNLGRLYLPLLGGSRGFWNVPYISSSLVLSHLKPSSGICYYLWEIKPHLLINLQKWLFLSFCLNLRIFYLVLFFLVQFNHC